MWLFHPLGFASVVANKADKSHQTLLVRSRFKDDLPKLFPGCKVRRTPQRDYLYRAVVSREAVAMRLAELVASITYDNFKDAVPSYQRAGVYGGVWETMYMAQREEERNVVQFRLPNARSRYKPSVPI